jgi:hypothetical protein
MLHPDIDLIRELTWQVQNVGEGWPYEFTRDQAERYLAAVVIDGQLLDKPPTLMEFLNGKTRDDFSSAVRAGVPSR